MKKLHVLLPMKDHSERIPNKNMRLFAGYPLYHAIVNTLLKSKYIKRIVVNTDSNVITDNVQRHFPAIEIFNRPRSIRGDYISMNRIIQYDLSKIDGNHFIQTHSTNPLLTVETIDQAIEAYFSNLDQYDSLLSVTRFQTRFYWEGGRAINHDPDKLLRTQDLPPVFEENSCFYIFSKKSFHRAENRRIGLKPFMYEINKLEAVDIDEEEDFKLAEYFFSIFMGEKDETQTKIVKSAT